MADLFDATAERGVIRVLAGLNYEPGLAAKRVEQEGLEPGMFADPSLAEVFRGIYELSKRHLGVDLPSVSLYLKASDAVAKMGHVWLAELLGGLEGGQLVDAWPHQLPLFAARVRELALRRSLAAEARRLMALAQDMAADPLEAINRSAGSLAAMAQRNPVTRTVRDGVDDAMTHMDLVSEGKKEPVLRTGLEHLDSAIGGLHPSELTIVGALPGVGKALAVDTEIPTPLGWKRMADMAHGDVVFAHTGEQTKVVRVSEVMHDRACYELELSDHTTVTADASHLWLARRASERNTGKLEVVTTEHLAATLFTEKDQRRNWAIPITGEAQLPDRPLPIHPYVLGVWLGDGRASGAVYSKPEPELAKQIRGAGYEVWQRESEADVWGIGTGPDGRKLQVALREAGLLGNKHVPPDYLRASPDQRRALLQGLMDTDGTCGKNGTCSFSNADLALAEAVAELAQSLGCKVTRYTRVPRVSNRPELICRREHRVIFTPNFPAFRLARKLARQDLANRCPWRYVVAARRVPTVPVRCIQVDHPSGTFLATRSWVPTHNSALGATISDNLAKRGVRVGFFSLEDEGQWLAWRLLSQAADVPQFVMRNRVLTDRQMARVAEGIKSVWDHTANILVDDRPALTSAQIVASARDMILNRGVRAIFVDHLGEIRPPGGQRRSERYDLDLKDILVDLRDLAKVHKIPVVLFAHLQRMEMGVAPRLENFANSQFVANMARVALGLYREPGGKTLNVAVLKQTNGDSGIVVELEFKGPASLVGDPPGPARERYVPEESSQAAGGEW